MKRQKIEQIEISRLIAHPDNPNRMDDECFDMLVGHIERSGNYEPVIVRAHPGREGDYQIINGHHRTKALGKLGHTQANCIVWDVDDDQVRILLATLNRLAGSDSIIKRSALVERLSQKLDPKALALASAATSTVLWIVCSILVALLPGMMMNMTGDMVHTNMGQMSWSLNFVGFSVGLLVWAALFGVTGWLIAVFYNRFLS